METESQKTTKSEDTLKLDYLKVVSLESTSERTLKLVTVTITTARPGLIIGKGGQEVDKLKEELKKDY